MTATYSDPFLSLAFGIFKSICWYAFVEHLLVCIPLSLQKTSSRSGTGYCSTLRQGSLTIILRTVDHWSSPLAILNFLNDILLFKIVFFLYSILQGTWNRACFGKFWFGTILKFKLGSDSFESTD